MSISFEWHSSKATSNFKKHGVGFEEAMTVFADPLARIFDDPDHSGEEQREIIVGQSAVRGLLVVSFAERRPLVRILSARRATRRERRDYEESVP